MTQAGDKGEAAIFGQLLMMGIPGPRVEAAARNLDLQFFHLAEILLGEQ